MINYKPNYEEVLGKAIAQKDEKVINSFGLGITAPQHQALDRYEYPGYHLNSQ